MPTVWVTYPRNRKTEAIAAIRRVSAVRPMGRPARISTATSTRLLMRNRRKRNESGSTCSSASLVAGKVAAKMTDRKSTRLNSSHGYISYAVFCLKKNVTDLAVRAIHANGFGRAENCLVVLNRLGSAPDDQVRCDGVVVLGNIRDFAHDLFSSESR